MSPEEEQSPLLEHKSTDNHQNYRSGGSATKEPVSDYSAAQIGGNDETDKNKMISWLRQTSPQVIAVTIQSSLFLSMGMTGSFPSVVIPVLRSLNSVNSRLHFSVDEASWYGSLVFIMMPVGCLTSGTLLQSIGCKNLMIIANLPFIGSWLMTYFAASKSILLIATALNGLATGLLGPSALRYASEVSHPTLRGILIAYSSLFIQGGCFLVFLLASLTDWRHVALTSVLVPIISIITLSLVPETPMWLMSKGRPADALKSLQWLRGWTSPEMVKNEYNKLEFYSSETPRALSRHKETSGEKHGKAGVSNNSAFDTGTMKVDDKDEWQQRDLKEVWRDITNKNTLVLLTKCMILFILSIFSATSMMEPYQLQVFAEMNLPLNPNTTAMITTLVAMAGNVGCLFLINLTGKKLLGILSFIIDAICLCLIGVYLMLPAPILEQDSTLYRWCALVLLSVSSLVTTLGIMPLTLIYLGEILPYRGRGTTTGIVKSVYYVAIFAGTKTFPATKQLLGLDGIYFVCGVFSLVGAFFMYFALPKTDDRFLSDIENDLTKAKNSGNFENN